jgi:hypothetical protein
MNRRAVLGLAFGWAGLVLCRGSLRANPTAAGAVRGTARGSGRNPAGPPTPLAGLTVVLLPRSAVLLDGLERLRRQSRDSMAAYRAAIPEMRRLVQALLDDLAQTGQTASVRSATIDGEGRFALEEVPTGDWMLIAFRALHVNRASHDRAKESGTYLPGTRLVGYDRVSVWLHTVAVESGRTQELELTDRNIWFEGVLETAGPRERTGESERRGRSAR